MWCEGAPATPPTLGPMALVAAPVEVNAGRGVMALWSRGGTDWYAAEAVSMARLGVLCPGPDEGGKDGSSRANASRRAQEMAT